MDGNSKTYTAIDGLPTIARTVHLPCSRLFNKVAALSRVRLLGCLAPLAASLLLPAQIAPTACLPAQDNSCSELQSAAVFISCELLSAPFFLIARPPA
ncbi:unnamed protein product [Ilex paraguariensis]|uniref:Uncharacterized protein n=1 Tax=Ilex paraguariensis TaxID=185542 RepID=A0ABC8UJ23_9AQUA